MTRQTRPQLVEAAALPDSPAVSAAQPSRILPRTGADGKPLDIDPPAGGSWLRDPDGGLRPADETTAAGAGLAAPGK